MGLLEHINAHKDGEKFISAITAVMEYVAETETLRDIETDDIDPTEHLVYYNALANLLLFGETVLEDEVVSTIPELCRVAMKFKVR